MQCWWMTGGQTRYNRKNSSIEVVTAVELRHHSHQQDSGQSQVNVILNSRNTGFFFFVEYRLWRHSAFMLFFFFFFFFCSKFEFSTGRAEPWVLDCTESQTLSPQVPGERPHTTKRNSHEAEHFSPLFAACCTVNIVAGHVSKTEYAKTTPCDITVGDFQEVLKKYSNVCFFLLFLKKKLHLSDLFASHL